MQETRSKKEDFGSAFFILPLASYFLSLLNTKFLPLFETNNKYT